MIIRFPTAQYESILPQAPEYGGNVTYTVSMNNPPRVFQTTIRLPPAVERREKSDKIIDDDTRRIHLGERIFTVSKTGKSIIGSSKKQFEVGQILTFGLDVDPEVDPMLVGDLELRHDTNLLDLAGLGLTAEDIANVSSSAMTRLKELQAELSGYTQQRSNAEIAINENKKTQNETQKAADAIAQLAATDSSFDEMLAELNAKLPILEDELDRYVGIANQAASNADITRDRILDLVQVVR